VALRGEKIAVLGDLHGKWNQRDNDYFDRADYDLLIFVGDLGSGSASSEIDIIRRIRALRVPTLVMPGNNDAHFLDLLYGETPEELLPGRVGASLTACGYSTHLLETSSGAVTILAARPCAMGGSEFSFGPELEKRYGVTGLDHSAGRLRRLVDECQTEAILFLAHNGPFGLGGEPDSPWARDFCLPEELEEAAPRDWGDRDLSGAIAYAKSCGKEVVGVIAGHIHRSTRAPRAPGGERCPVVKRQGGSSFINAAVVPRIIRDKAGERHHFVELKLELGADAGLRVRATEVWRDLQKPPRGPVVVPVSLAN
jgi:uncharacterized protein (TIGR04168 family)